MRDYLHGCRVSQQLLDVELLCLAAGGGSGDGRTSGGGALVVVHMRRRGAAAAAAAPVARLLPGPAVISQASSQGTQIPGVVSRTEMP